MEILRNDENKNLIVNTESDFQTNLGWQENMVQFEDEVLSTIINPIENYETVRYIHKPYTGYTGLEQTDIWYYFYFLTTGKTYEPDYNIVGIDTHENAKMLKQATKSFFRLEFYKTPIISGTTCEAPSRINRKLVFAKNLSLPLGEKYFYNGNNINEFIHFPVFMGSNYKNKENMYLFWFQDESVLTGTTLSGNTFWMTAKFYNAEDGSIIDFVNDIYSTGKTINDTTDMYYQVILDKTDYSYQVYKYTGDTVTTKAGTSTTPIKFYQRGGGSAGVAPTPTPTPTNTPTRLYIEPDPSPTPTITPTPTTSTVYVATTPTSTRTPTPSVSSTGGLTPTPTPSVSSTGGLTPTPTPSVSSTGGVTPTPTPTRTPTPTVTQSGSSSGCFTINTSDSYTSITCLGNSYSNTTTRVTATLNATSAVNVTIRVNATRYWCYGGNSSEQYDITITAGNISNYVDITTTAYVDCGQGSCEIESISIDGYTSLNPNYSGCS